MVTDRQAQARAEAERRYPTYPEFDQDERDYTNAMRYIFLGGAEWADANPQPTILTHKDMGTVYAAFVEADGHPVRRLIVALKVAGIEVEDNE